MSSLPTVAIVGRINVGKSTLFNRIAGRRVAIVDNEPGVTRDRNITLANWIGHDFFVIDTGGLAPGSEDPFQEGIEQQIRLALSEADAVILVVDAASGVHPFDIEAAELVRTSGLPAFLAVNKVDNNERMSLASEFYRLGLGYPWPVSALHGLGAGDLLDAVVNVLPKTVQSDEDEVAFAVVGRPNVGKSSLVNRICREERNIVTDVPGTTRDSIDTVVEWNENRILIVDTAGLRRKSRKMDDIEFYSTVRTWKSVARGDVVLVMMDTSEYPVSQDIRIIAKAWEMGKGVIIGVNKIDLGIDRNIWIEKIIQKFHPAKWIPVLFLSAKEGNGVGRVLPTVVEVDKLRAIDLPTSEINRKIQNAVADVQPPSPKGRQVKLYYATQVGHRPPRILIFANYPEDIPENYRRYIENKLRDYLGLKGVPLKVIYRKRKH